MQDRDMLLVCFNHADMNNPHLTIGRREPGDKAELIRVVEGEEARELYFRLLGKNDTDDNSLNDCTIRVDYTVFGGNNTSELYIWQMLPDDKVKELNYIQGEQAKDLYSMFHHHIEKKAMELHLPPPEYPVGSIYAQFKNGSLHVGIENPYGPRIQVTLDNPEGRELYFKLIGKKESEPK